MRFKYTAIFGAVVGMLSGTMVIAQTVGNEKQLEQIEVTTTYSKRVVPLGKTKVLRKQLESNLVQDSQDLVRYDPGVTVSEGGRSGSNGFQIRGVDADRVAITIDGLTQGESRSSTAFQEIFGAYGNYNTNRNATELENIKSVDVYKGADSVTAGSGALGGAVMYLTKSPEDYLKGDKNYYIGFKGGYLSRSEERMGSLTLAGRLGKLEGLIVATRRHGHELKNFSQDNGVTCLGYDATTGECKNSTAIGGQSVRGVFRNKPDPQTIDSVSTLLKLGYHINESNYLGIVYEDYRQDRKTNELSNLWSTYDEDLATRLRNDISYRQRYGLEFENWRDHGPWDRLHATLDHQFISMKTFSWDLPDPAKVKSRDSTVDFTTRGIYQKNTQFNLKAEKHVEFDTVSWDMTYGGGYNFYKNTNDNEEYAVYYFYPNRRSSSVFKDVNLISAKTHQYDFFINNALTFHDKYKLNVGLRYDHYENAVLPDENFNQKMAEDGLLGAKAKFSSITYALGLNWDITPTLTAMAKYNTGFRAPTVDEMWFSFPHPDFNLLYNPKLKPERAQNIELGVDVHGSWGNIKLSAFNTQYKNFIDLMYLGARKYQIWSKGQYTLSNYEAPTYQNVNRYRAIVRGIELSGQFNLNKIGLPKGSYATVAASYNVGKTEDGRPLNAIQPFNAVLGLGYRQPDDRWSLGVNLTYTQRKAADDTMDSADFPDDAWPFVKFSKAYFLVDVLGHYQYNKHITVRAGVFNVFNQKYFTWDSLRSIREYGVVNRVDPSNHYAGIGRFSAPGRNFSVFVTAEF